MSLDVWERRGAASGMNTVENWLTFCYNVVKLFVDLIDQLHKVKNCKKKLKQILC